MRDRYDFSKMKGRKNPYAEMLKFQEMVEIQQLDRITFDPNIMGGTACICGMRLPVSVIIEQVAYGVTPEEILEDYPFLEPEDIEQALKYSKMMERKNH